MAPREGRLGRFQLVTPRCIDPGGAKAGDHLGREPAGPVGRPTRSRRPPIAAYRCRVQAECRDRVLARTEAAAVDGGLGHLFSLARCADTRDRSEAGASGPSLDVVRIDSTWTLVRVRVAIRMYRSDVLRGLAEEVAA